MLEVREVNKRYGTLVANDNVTFDVAPGRMVGFVGPNGAGKSTTMRAVMGLVEPDSGTIRWNGRAVDADTRRSIGYLPEQRGLYPKMKIGEQVGYFAQLKSLDRATAASRTVALLGELGLGDRLNDPLEKLSHGNQQRVQLAVALVTEPELLILDEPFTGLDPVATEKLQEVLAARVAAGAAVLFSSHQLPVVEQICDEIVIIVGGRIEATGTLDAVRDAGGARRATVRVDRPVMPLADALAGLPIIEHTTRSATVEVRHDTDLAAVLDRAAQAGPVVEFHYAPPPLGQLFAELVAKAEVPA